MTEQTIKPCPFCGTIPTLKFIPGSYGYYPEAANISCCNGISIGKATEEYDWDKRKHVDTRKSAIAFVIDKWNRRV